MTTNKLPSLQASQPEEPPSIPDPSLSDNWLDWLDNPSTSDLQRVAKAPPTSALARKIPSLYDLKPRTPEQRQALHDMFKAKIAAKKAKAKKST